MKIIQFASILALILRASRRRGGPSPRRGGIRDRQYQFALD